MDRNAKLSAEQTHAGPAAEPVAPTPSTRMYAGLPTAVGQPRGFIDAKSNSPRMLAQSKLIEGIQNSPRMVVQRRQIESLFGDAAQRMGAPEEEELLQGKFEAIQRQGPEEEKLLQGKFAPVQRQGGPEEDLLQGMFAPVQRTDVELDRGPRENKTGLPDNLKTGVESLSGMSLDNVRVHYNSAQPAQLNALAYAQGADIHVAPGQEQHLPHEAWHIVQQAQGRVQPTMQMKDGVPVNDDAGLEREADVMGEKAVQMRHSDQVATDPSAKATTAEQRTGKTAEASEVQGARSRTSEEKVRLNFLSTAPIQRKPVPKLVDGMIKWYDDRDPTQTLYDSELEAGMFGSFASFDFLGTEQEDRPVPIFDIRGPRVPIRERHEESVTEQELRLVKEFLAQFEEDPEHEQAMVRAILQSQHNNVTATEAILDQLVRYQLYAATAQDPHLLRLATSGKLEALGTLIENCFNRDTSLVRQLLAKLSFDELQSVAYFGRGTLTHIAALTPDRIIRFGQRCPDRVLQVRLGRYIEQGLDIINVEGLMAENDFPALLDVIQRYPVDGSYVNARIAVFGLQNYITLMRVPGINLRDIQVLTEFPVAAIPALSTANVGDLRSLCRAFVMPASKITIANLLVTGETVATIVSQVGKLRNNGVFYCQLLAHGLTVPNIGIMCGFGQPGLAQLMATLGAGQMTALATVCSDALVQLRLAEKLAGGLTPANLHALSQAANFAAGMHKLTVDGLNGAAIDAAVTALNAANYVLLLNIAGVGAELVHQLTPFGVASVATLAGQTAEILGILNAKFNSPAKKAAILNLLPIPTLCGYAAGPLGQGPLGKLTRAANGPTITGPVGIMGEQKYADTLTYMQPNAIPGIAVALNVLQAATIRKALAGFVQDGVSPNRITLLINNLLTGYNALDDIGFTTLMDTSLEYLISYATKRTFINKLGQGTNPTVMSGRATRIHDAIGHNDTLNQEEKEALAIALSKGEVTRSDARIKDFVAVLQPKGHMARMLWINKLDMFAQDWARDYTYRQLDVAYHLDVVLRNLAVNVQVAGIVTPVNVQIVQQRLNHFVSGHTFKYYNMRDANIDRSGTSSMFNLGTGIAEVNNLIDAHVPGAAATMNFPAGGNVNLSNPTGNISIRRSGGVYYLIRFYLPQDQCTDQQIADIKPLFT